MLSRKPCLIPWVAVFRWIQYQESPTECGPFFKDKPTTRPTENVQLTPEDSVDESDKLDQSPNLNNFYQLISVVQANYFTGSNRQVGTTIKYLISNYME